MKRAEQRAEATLERDAARIDGDDLDRVLSRRERIERKVREHPRLAGFIDQIQTLFELIRDYRSGTYRSIPWGSIAAAAATLLYILNPMDMVPDFIPFVGLIDDATVFAFCLKLIGRDLDRYKEQKPSPSEEPQQELEH